MPQFVKHFVQDLTQDIKIRQCGTIVFNADDEANVITIDLYNGEEPATLTGSVVGAVICSDGSTVPVTGGTISGNTVTLTLTGDCGAIPGPIGVGVQIVNGTQKTTVLKAVYNVELFTTDNVVDPGSRITITVSDLVSDIESATAEIPASDMASLMAGIAPTFSTSTNYSAGAYVYYDGTLYKFTLAHSAGSWTGTDAAQVALANDVSTLNTAVAGISNVFTYIQQDIDDLNTDVDDLKSAVTQITYNEVVNGWVNQKYIKTDVDPVNISSPVVNSAYAYVIVPCSAGDVFTLTGTGAVAAGLWTFVDANGYKKDQAANNAVGKNLVITAPEESAFLIVNVKPASAYFLCKGYYLQKRLSDLEQKTIYDTGYEFTRLTGYIRNDTGGIVSNQAYRYTVVPVVPGQKIIYNGGFNPGGIVGAGFYDVQNVFIPGTGLSCTKEDQVLTVPLNAYYFKGTISQTNGSINYASDAAVSEAVADNKKAIVDYATNPEIVVPSTSIAVVGHQWILYFNGVISGLYDAHYVIVSIAGIDSTVPILYDDSVRLTPTSAMIGDHTCTIVVRAKSSGNVVAQKSFTLKVIADSPVSGKKAIYIGDSLTDDGYYPCEIQANLSNGGVLSVGTKEDTRTIGDQSITAANEGRGGWTTSNYMNDATVGNVSNPFYNPSTQTFDFSYYMTQNGFSGIDIVSIYLGTNGDSTFDITIQNLLAMAQSIHAYDENIKVIICLFHQVANQSGCGNHNGLQSSVRMQRGRIASNKVLIDTFENNADYPYISIAELCFGVDGNNDYAKVTQALSSRNPETVVRLNNNVHPNVYGYLKIADNLYNRMLYLLTQGT